MIPAQNSATEPEDQELIREALKGSPSALADLVERHQRFVYNVALKMVADPADAADMTQEVLIKMVTKLSQYRAESSFTTWLYRMVINHFISVNRKKTEAQIDSFEEFGDFIDNAYVDENMTRDERQTYADQIVATRNKCMTSLLLCLDRGQRIVVILGSIFSL